MKYFLRLILSLPVLFFACKTRQGETKTSITDNEDKGIKEILAFYNGQCEYGMETKAGLGKDSEKNFWLKVSSSPAVNRLEKTPEMPGSNIAYLFYKNLDKEKASYDRIESELIFDNGQSQKFSYTMSQLEQVKSKIPLIDKIADLIKTKNFADLKNYLRVDSGFFKYDIDNLVSNLQGAEGEFGNVIKFIPYGFRFSKAADGKEMLHISGLLSRDRKSNYFSVDLDPASLKEEVYSLNYQL